MIPKFRIFDKKKKRFLGDFTMEIDKFGIHVLDEFNYVVDEDDRVLMQSTGLHDKNGKEIFEGDILHHPLQGMRKVYYPFLDTVASYGLENIENGMRNTLEDAHRLYEVVGNIYSHSHLLDNGGYNNEHTKH